GTRTQDAGQRVIDRVGLTKPDNTAILFHGVSLSLRGSGRLDTRLDTPPISDRHHPVFRLALRRVPAAEIERAVVDQVRGLLRAPEMIVKTWRAGRRLIAGLT